MSVGLLLNSFFFVLLSAFHIVRVLRLISLEQRQFREKLDDKSKYERFLASAPILFPSSQGLITLAQQLSNFNNWRAGMNQNKYLLYQVAAYLISFVYPSVWLIILSGFMALPQLLQGYFNGKKKDKEQSTSDSASPAPSTSS
jgi:hypothetical protein